MVQGKIEKDCVATAAASLADIVSQGSAWLGEPGLRSSLAEVMPQAAAAVAAQRQQHHAGGQMGQEQLISSCVSCIRAACLCMVSTTTVFMEVNFALQALYCKLCLNAGGCCGSTVAAGGRPLHRGQGVHRRSGSAGSSSALRLAGSGKAAGHLPRSGSSNSMMLAQGANAGAAAAGVGSRLVAAVVAVLAAVLRGVQAAGCCIGAVAGRVGAGGAQQLAVSAVLLVVGVQLMLLWQVVLLQQRVVDLLQLQQQAACKQL
jgi:hypothetical protein